jgi:hypothetical protein
MEPDRAVRVRLAVRDRFAAAATVCRADGPAFRAAACPAAWVATGADRQASAHAAEAYHRWYPPGVFPGATARRTGGVSRLSESRIVLSDPGASRQGASRGRDDHRVDAVLLRARIPLLPGSSTDGPAKTISSPRRDASTEAA